jgi:hypothetical protein
MAVNQAARVPTDAELAQINQYVPSGYAKLTADEVGIVSVMVTNNLLTYNYQKWSIASLNVMPSLITGKQSTVNHDSWNVEKVLGKIFNATYTKSRNVPAAKLNSVNAYQADLNKEIVAKEGYAEVTADIYYPRKAESDFAGVAESDASEIVNDVMGQRKNDATIDVPELDAVNARISNLVATVKMLTDQMSGSDSDPEETLQKIRFGLYDRVSLGSFDYTALRCPDCACEKGFPDMYRPDEICPLGFLPPMPEWGYEPNAEIGMWNGQIIKVAPYAIRDGLRNAEEISFVLAGNNPFASTVKG